MPLIVTVKVYGIYFNCPYQCFWKTHSLPKRTECAAHIDFLLCNGFVRIIQPVIKSWIDFSKQVYCNTWSIFLNKRSLFELTKQAMLTQYETHLNQDFISCLFLSTENWNWELKHSNSFQRKKTGSIGQRLLKMVNIGPMATNITN